MGASNSTRSTEEQSEIEQWVKISTEIRLMVTGKIGSGKSTLLNWIVGEKMFIEGEMLQRETLTVCQTSTAGVDIKIFGTPGLQDGSGNEQTYLSAMKEKCTDIHLLLYCISMLETRGDLHAHDSAIKLITKALGTSIWENAVIVLTFSNTFERRLSDQGKTERAVKNCFKERMKEFEVAVRDSLRDAGVSNEITQNVTAIPVGYAKKPDLVCQKSWLSNFWTKSLSMMKEKAQAAMVKVLIDRENITPYDFDKDISRQPIVSKMFDKAVGKKREAKFVETEKHLTASQHCATEAERKIQELTVANCRLHEELAENLKRFSELRKSFAVQTEQRVAEDERRIHELTVANRRLDEDHQNMERKAEVAEQRCQDLETQWVVNQREIQMTERQLGKGGWGFVKVAKFRGIEVAAKSQYEQISSPHYRHLFIREMNMAARLRHPHLVQFIGATLEGGMIILTELMHTSLRSVLEQRKMPQENIVSISVQVCQALNYLHLMQPDPVIHRDISSANVLLNPLSHNCWMAKVADYGSVNTLRALVTENPGNPVYAAPEAKTPTLQSIKMDIFSLGVLLIEMCSGQFPSDDGHEHLLYTIKARPFITIIKRCINQDKEERPTAMELKSELEQL